MVDVQLETGVPVIYGVLNCLTTGQGERCALRARLSAAVFSVQSALHMLTLNVDE
jgi:6,7-dimethyl-8-ribityllumazine synthase